MPIPDRWNPRVWLRNWLMKPGTVDAALVESRVYSSAEMREMFGELVADAAAGKRRLNRINRLED